MSEPTVRSAVYQAPFLLDKTDMVVKAKAFAPHMSPSEVTESVAFRIEAFEPSFEPNGGVFVENVQLAMACQTPGAKIFYTLDGSEPGPTSTMYAGAFAIGMTDIVVKAVAIKTGLAASNVVESSAFTVEASAPKLDPAEGIFTAEAQIAVSSATPGAEMRCTLDGSEPSADTPVVSSPVSVTETGSIVRCVATKAGLTVSDVTSMASALEIKATAPVMTPDGGDFTNEASVVMSCETAGCTIRYTTDGTTPVLTSPTYTEPVVVTETGTVIKCIAVAEGKSASAVSASGLFSMHASAPTFSSNGEVWPGAKADGENFYVEEGRRREKNKR